MAGEENSSIQTRPSLLDRLKGGDDTESWQEFYRIYGKLVRDFATQAGLTATEADEVVQETAIGASKHLPEYRYDPKVCRFKTWLLNQASWRIKDQLKKRQRAVVASGGGENVARRDEDGSRTETVHRVPDPSAVNLDALFEQEWRKNLFAAALERVKGRFSLKQYQIFDLLVLQEWPAAQVAKSLGVSLANVYVTRHRLSMAVKKEIVQLEKRFEEAAQAGGAAQPSSESPAKLALNSKKLE
jgi:RNA polymerase sigma-70 factor (ECF subfamily)